MIAAETEKWKKVVEFAGAEGGIGPPSQRSGAIAF